MKPVYDVDGIQIWHADCADVLPLIEPDTVGLLLTDPPYGIKLESYRESMPAQGFKGSPPPRDYAPIVGDDKPFDPRPLLNYPLVLFGLPHMIERLPNGGVIVWDKTGGGKTSTMLSDGELAWTNLFSGVHIFHHMWLAIFRDSELNNRGLHPTQKPVALMRWIVDKWTEPGDLILDPYMGSGPVARACADLGRRYIGIEIVEEYVNTAIGRLGQTAMVFEP